MATKTTGRVILRGSERKPLANSQVASAIYPAEVAQVTVRVRPANSVAELSKTVDKLYAQPMDKRNYLTREELAVHHGARREDLDAIEHFAHRHNLTVTHRRAAERSLVLSGK